MKLPRYTQGNPDRSLELEEHLEPLFETLITVAVSVGYTEPEALAAIASLVDNRQLANAENFVTDVMIAEAAKRAKDS